MKQSITFYGHNASACIAARDYYKFMLQNYHFISYYRYYLRFKTNKNNINIALSTRH